MARLKDKKEEITGPLDPKYWVQKSDPLVLMRSVPFSLGELKILDTYISRINAKDDTRRTVIFTKEEYEELMGLTCVDYRTLKKHTEGMLGKVVTLEMPDKEYLQFVLFEQARYHKDEYGKPIVELTCTTLAQDLFFFIKENETKYQYFKYALENVINLTRKASYLLYLHVIHERYRGEWEVDLKELRDKVLDCKAQQTYQEFKEFKKAVLAPAVKEVNEKTDCHFDYEAIKRGRRVAKIKFIYHSKEQVDGQLSFDTPVVVPQLSDQSEGKAEKEEIDYGGELANLLGDAALNNEFSPEQVRVIQDLVLRIVPSRDHLELCNYLIERVHRMNAYNPRKDRRFAYLRKMLEKELKN